MKPAMRANVTGKITPRAMWTGDEAGIAQRMR
jgi:hypothetical protein